MKKGQMREVFNLIFIAIVILVIIIIGMKTINILHDKGCDVKERKLVETLEDSFVTYSTYGTKQDLNLPGVCNGKAICFFNTKAEKSQFSNPTDASEDNILTDSELKQIKSSSDNNVFLIRNDGTIKELASSDKIITNNNNELFCVKLSDGQFKVRVEGQGQKILFKNP